MFFPRITEATNVIHIEFHIVHMNYVAVCWQYWYNLKRIAIVPKFLDCLSMLKV